LLGGGGGLFGCGEKKSVLRKIQIHHKLL